MDLTGVSLTALQALLALAERGESPASASLPAEVLGAAAPLGAMPAGAAAELLRAVIAERRRERGAKIDLVWTGPEAKVSLARDTAVVVAEMFGAARKSVLIGGYAFDHGYRLFEALHRVMKERGVKADAFLDMQPVDGVAPEEAAKLRRDEFLRGNWPFGEPLPTIYYYPDGISKQVYASIHAKCVVVDEIRSLVTSANFTDRGQTRNIEVGVLIEDAAFAEALSRQWWGAAGAGVFRQVS